MGDDLLDQRVEWAVRLKERSDIFLSRYSGSSYCFEWPFCRAVRELSAFGRIDLAQRNDLGTLDPDFVVDQSIVSL